MASKSTLGGSPVTQGQSGAGVQGTAPSASAALPTATPPPMNVGLGSQGAGGKGGGGSPLSNYVQQWRSSGMPSPRTAGVTGTMPMRPTGMPAPAGIASLPAVQKPIASQYTPGVETRGMSRFTPLSAEEADRRFAASQGIAAIPQG